MKQETYESPYITKVSLQLEQCIAGSTLVEPHPGTGSFQESWNEETVLTGDIEIL